MNIMRTFRTGSLSKILVLLPVLALLTAAGAIVDGRFVVPNEVPYGRPAFLILVHGLRVGASGSQQRENR